MSLLSSSGPPNERFPSFKALSSVRPSFVPNRWVSFPWGPSHTLPSTMAPPLVTLFRTYVSFSFEMQILEAGSAAELASHPMAPSSGGMGGAGPCRCSQSVPPGYLLHSRQAGYSPSFRTDVPSLCLSLSHFLSGSLSE